MQGHRPDGESSREPEAITNPHGGRSDAGAIFEASVDGE